MHLDVARHLGVLLALMQPARWANVADRRHRGNEIPADAESPQITSHPPRYGSAGRNGQKQRLGDRFSENWTRMRLKQVVHAHLIRRRFFNLSNRRALHP